MAFKAHQENPGQSLQIKSFNFIIPTNTFFLIRYNSQVPEIRMCPCLWRPSSAYHSMRTVSKLRVLALMIKWCFKRLEGRRKRRINPQMFLGRAAWAEEGQCKGPERRTCLLDFYRKAGLTAAEGVGRREVVDK